MKNFFKRPSIYFRTVPVLLLFLQSTPLFAHELSQLNPFLKDYFTFEIAKNSPIINTQDKFDGKYATYSLGFRHNLNENWFAGLSMGFKSFNRIDKNRELAFLTLNHEILYIIRLYHPTYLFVGPKILYLLPTQRSKFPILRDPDYDTEVGAALTATLTQMLTKSVLLTARIDRWRGTKTNHFHGTEVAFGFQISFE